MYRRELLQALVAGLLIQGIPSILSGEAAGLPASPPAGDYDGHIRDYFLKMKNFNKPYPEDIRLEGRDLLLLESSIGRLRRLQRTVGHGNFYLLSFDDAIRYARRYPGVGAFPKEELDFLEKIFYEDSTPYGFLGEKPLKEITDRVPRRETLKIEGTGNHLYRGKALDTYRRIKDLLGDQVVLTSGIRGIVKQTYLFLNKAYRCQGNLSLASRSLAPPGYSFHGIGDFDVGQAGFGISNFTERFTGTQVYRRLKHLGYLKLRYRQNNLLGVRFEPWHIKVV